MEILITNDDGWGAKGIMTLTALMRQFGHITVVAPDGARSGMSNAVSATRPMTLHKVSSPEFPDIDLYLTNGTPSDCVKLAINVIYGGNDRGIDLLVSGINHGSNGAVNVIYSGTMGACLVGSEHGIPSIGFSIYDMSSDPDFSHFERYIVELTRHLLDIGIQPGLCYNINAPIGPIKGIKWTRQCRSHWEKEMKPTTLENGETAYLLSGYLVNDEPEATDTDEWALTHGYVSVQPCSVDMTVYAAL